MADNENLLKDLLLKYDEKDSTEDFIRRIIRLALEKAEIVDFSTKDAKKFKVPTNDNPKSLAADWTKKLYTVERDKNVNADITDKELTEFKQTMEKWGNALGEEAVTETATALAKLKGKDRDDDGKIIDCLKTAIKKILDKWNTKSLKNKIYGALNGYCGRIQNLSAKVKGLDFVVPKNSQDKNNDTKK